MTKVTAEFILDEVLQTPEEKRKEYLSKLLNQHRTQVLREVWEAPFMQSKTNTIARIQLLDLIQ